MRLLTHFLAVGLLASPAAALDEAADSSDIFDIVQGDWRIALEDGSVVQTCEQFQHFEVSPEKDRIVLSEPWAEFTATYRVVYAEQYRVLTIIEGEDNTTEQGDPFLWWFYAIDEDSFAFRRADWPADEVTSSRWHRCD